VTRYVITPEVAIELVERIGRGARLAPDVKLVAPTLLRSEVLAILYRRVAAGELDKKQADARLDAVRRLYIRLLGDRVLQARAWNVAAELGWSDTYAAEYVALTRLQADALVAGDEVLAAAVRHLVTVAPIDDLLDS
jgi:predicted nucleic acid-binding protein